VLNAGIGSRTSSRASGVCWNTDMKIPRRMVLNRSKVSAMDVVTRRIFSQAREGIIVLFLGWLAATGELRQPG
jgi:hypothetical protein